MTRRNIAQIISIFRDVSSIPSSGLIKTRLLVFIKPEDGIENISRNADIIPTILGHVITHKSHIMCY
jgi:hypothetical protein